MASKRPASKRVPHKKVATDWRRYFPVNTWYPAVSLKLLPPFVGSTPISFYVLPIKLTTIKRYHELNDSNVRTENCLV